jgi:septum formation protein
LQALHLPFDVLAADVDEAPLPHEEAAPYVERLARSKAAAVAALCPGSLVLGADTAVVLDRQILGKPKTAEHAEAMLASLSGRSHDVLTGVALAGTASLSRVVTTRVHFRTLSTAEIRWYVATGEPMDKAGAYAVQGTGGFCIQAIEGSPSNVIGLPLVETLELLSQAGAAFPWAVSR